MLDNELPNPNSFKDHGYSHISTVVGKSINMMEQVRSGNLSPIVTELLSETENIGGYYPTDQIVIAARSGAGKTAKLLIELKDFCNFNLNPFYAKKFMILYDSYEMSDWRNILRLISREANIEAKALLDYHKRLTEERFDALKLIAKTFVGLPIYISTHPKTVDQWKESKKQIQGRFPQYYILNAFDHSRLIAKKDESKEEERLTSLMVAGVDLKNNFNQINIYLNQMNRNIETGLNRERLGTQLPVASDMFGSDAIMQCADVVKALHRPGLYGLELFGDVPTGIDYNNPLKPDDLLLEVILKQREGWTGVLKLKHNLAHNQIWDFPKESKQLITKEEDF